jgi:nitrous oxidase accessory protein NosD
MRSRIAATAALASGALLLAAPLAHANTSPTLTVDDNKVECPQAQYTTISAAVLAAAPGSTIKVCPGTYNEKVLVNKSLTLQGVRKGIADPRNAPDPTKEPVVVNAGQGAFDVTANHVTIDSFRIQGQGITDAVYPGAGIDLRGNSDVDITDNVITGNGIGVHINGAQQDMTIARDVFIGNNRGSNPNFIPTGGIFQDAGAADDSRIAFNVFTKNDQFAVNMGSGSNHGLSIDHNLIRDDDTFVVIGRTTGASIDDNLGSKMTGNFVFAFGDNKNLVIDDNTGSGVTGVSGTAILQVDPSFGTTQADTGTRISDNSMSQFFNGVRLAGGSGANVFENDLSNNDANGIRLGGGAGVTNSRVVGNTTNKNGENGILADANSSQNTIQSNRAQGNTAFDCRDDSTGSGTAGTANFWIQNSGNTQNRPGLCKPGRH